MVWKILIGLETLIWQLRISLLGFQEHIQMRLTLRQDLLLITQNLLEIEFWLWMILVMSLIIIHDQLHIQMFGDKDYLMVDHRHSSSIFKIDYILVRDRY